MKENMGVKTLKSIFETYKGSILKILLVYIFLLGIMVSYAYFNRAVGLHDDNAFEEALELDLEYFTGIEVDVTPQSPEK